MSFWTGRRVLVTGHTGFKGAWAARWLYRKGARVTGLSLPPEPAPNLSRSLRTEHLLQEHLVDLRKPDAVQTAVQESMPEIVLHMAAQPIVRVGYDDPIGTFATNIMGTSHLLESLRKIECLKAVLVVTSDKVYENDESGRAFTEEDRLGGDDPYSASKAAVEILAASYARSFFDIQGIPVATARGGNVIGGGDFSADRLIPDIVRAVQANTRLTLRNPNATRPWQHVLDCLSGYLHYTEQLAIHQQIPRAMNFGPNANEASMSVGQLTQHMLQKLGIGDDWALEEKPQPSEKLLLSVDARKASTVLGWSAKLDADKTIEWTTDWYSGFLAGADATNLTDAQIDAYEEFCS